MAFDGRVKFDTSLDKSGLENGLKSAASTAKKAAVAITTTIATGTGAAIKFGSDFEKAMSSVYAISRASSEDAAKLKEAALEAGRVTQFSASQSANALEYLSLAGYTATESIEALPKVLNLAAAGGMDLAYASDLLTDSMAVMGLGIESMDNFSDQLAMAASKSNTSVAQLGEAVLVAGGQAKLCGMEVAEMNTALGILADKGIKGSEGGTALRNTLKNLYTPTSAAAKELARLGVATADAEGNLRPMQDVLKDLNAALAGMTADEKTKAMDKIFDTRTIAAATALLDDCNDRWSELEGYLRDCDGAAEQMAETMNDNLQGKLKLVASAAESVAIAFYDSISEPLKDAADEGANQLSILAQEMREGELKEGIEELGVGLGSLISTSIELARDVLPSLLSSLGWICENIGVIGPLVLGIVGAVKAYTIATTAAQVITALLNTTLMLNPVGLVCAGVVALTAAVISFANAMDGTQGPVAEVSKDIASLEKENRKLTESFEESMRSLTLETAKCEKLADALDTLMAVENKSEEQKRDMAKTVELLNELMPELKLQYDKENDVVKTSTGEILANTEALRENIKERQKAKAREQYEAQYDAWLKQAEEAQKKYQEAEAALMGAKSDKAAGEAAWDMYNIFSVFSGDAWNNWLGNADRNIARAEANLERTGELVNEAYAQTERYQGLLNAVDFEINTEGVVADVTTSVVDTIEELDAALKTATSADEKRQIFIDYITLMPEDLATAVATMEENGMYVVEGFQQGISSRSQVLYGEIATLLGTTISEVKNTLGIQSPSTVFKEIGMYTLLGLIAGLKDNSELVNLAIEKVASDLIATAKTKLGIHSPSTKFRDEIGAMIPKGMAVGIKENSEEATKAYEALLDVLDRQLEAGIITEEEYFMGMENLRDTYLTQGTKEWLDATQKLYDGTLELEEKAIDEEFDLLRYRYNTGVITEREYYEELKKYRDKYFEENSEEWRNYTEQIIDYEKEAAEELTETIEEAYEDAFDNVNDSIKDLSDELSSIGDFYVTGTVEINGEEVGYGKLSDMDKRNEWLIGYRDRLLGVQKRLNGIGITEEEAKEFFASLSAMNVEDANDYANLLMNSSDSEFAEFVTGWLKNRRLSEEIANGIFADDKKDAEEAFATELVNILTEAGKELPDDFWELGDLSGESFSDSFLEGVRKAIAEASSMVQTFVSGAGLSGGGGYSATYNFYSSGQTVSEQLTDAQRNAAVERARYG